MMNKALSVLAVVAILGASFYAGQKSFPVVEYEHSEVVDTIESCGENTYIGGCNTCKTCEQHEYNAGGCSYFKDTLCTLCTVLPHCPTFNTQCKNKYDETCVAPGCDDQFWIDNGKCSPCTVCGEDEFVSSECSMAADTVCSACTSCGSTDFVSQVCKIDSVSKNLLLSAQQGVLLELDTVCEPCVACRKGDWCDEVCVLGDFHTEGKQTSCAACKKCPDSDWASESCKIGPGEKTGCTDCSQCDEGQYIDEECDNGSPFDADGLFMDGIVGTDTLCADCTPRGDTQWTVFPCDPLHTKDAVHQECSTCAEGEYELAACTEFTDTVCPACPDSADTKFLGDPDFKSGLQYCKEEAGTARSMVRCEAVEKKTGGVTAGASFCGFWSSPIEDQTKCQATAYAKYSTDCGAWTSNCEDGFSGKSCCLHKKDMNCGTLTTRERDGKRNGFVAGEDFIAFCEDLCEEFPDCMAFEVKKELGNKPTCYFKSSYTQNNKQQWTGADDKWDCYSNTCRQNSYVGRPAINYSPDAGDAKRKSPIMGGRRR